MISATGFEFEIATHGGTAVFRFPERVHVVLRGGEAVRVKGGHAHARLGEAVFEGIAPVGLLHVFAEREFDALHRPLKLQALGTGAVAQFDHAVLSADGVGGTVQLVGHGEAAGELLMDRLGLGIDDIGHANHRGGGQRAFVHAAHDHAVVVAVDESRRDVDAGQVNDVRISRHVSGRADDAHFPADDEQIRVFHAPLGAAGPDRGILDQHGGRRQQRTAILLRRRGGERVTQLRLVLLRVRLLVITHRGGKLSPVDPHFAHPGFLIEGPAFFEHGEMRQFSRLDAAELVADAAEPGGHGCQRGEGVAGAEAAGDGETHIRAKACFLSESMCRESDLAAFTAEQGRIARGLIPGTQLIERHRQPVIVVGEFGSLGKIHGHDERRVRFAREIRPAPFLAAGENDRVQRELPRQPARAGRHERASRLEDHRHGPAGCGQEGVEGGAEGRTRTVGRVLREMRVIRGLKLRVEQGLPHHGDDTHERSRIRFRSRGAIAARRRSRSVDGDVLKCLGPDDGESGISGGQRYESAHAANDSRIRDDIRRGEALLAQRLK